MSSRACQLSHSFRVSLSLSYYSLSFHFPTTLTLLSDSVPCLVRERERHTHTRTDTHTGVLQSSMKGEGKMVLNSRMKWVGLVGLVLSAFSLFIHFLLARFSAEAIVDYQSSITLFSWRPIFESPLFPITVMCQYNPTYCFCFFLLLCSENLNAFYIYTV